MLLMSTTMLLVEGSSSPSTGSSISSMILRIRNTMTGQMERKLVSDPSTQSLKQILSMDDDDASYCCMDSKTNEILDLDKCISQLSCLSNGSILILTTTNKNKDTKGRMQQKKATKDDTDEDTWEPFPELSRNTNQHRRRRRTSSSVSSRRVRSFGDYDNLYHTVEAQTKGPIERMYVCSNGASQFQRKVSTKNDRMAWLFGTVQTERVDKNQKRKPKTSLSSATESSKTCQVAKVQATWEPPLIQSNNNDDDDVLYDASTLVHPCSNTQRAFQIATWLGLKPIGWIFSYKDDRTTTQDDNNDDATEGILPVMARDVYYAAKGQSYIMKHYSNNNNNNNEDDETPRAWLTAAMDASTGATEVFQLSDVSVQMVHEGVIGQEQMTNSGRIMKTTQPIMIASQESHDLDSVLCLVNTAVLSHVGLYSTSNVSTGVTKKGLLTKSIKAKLTSLLLQPNSSSDILQQLCNFPLLVALDRFIQSHPQASSSKQNGGDDDDDDPMKRLCELVRRYARGQTKSTKIPKDLQLLLQHVLQ